MLLDRSRKHIISRNERLPDPDGGRQRCGGRKEAYVAHAALLCALQEIMSQNMISQNCLAKSVSTLSFLAT